MHILLVVLHDEFEGATLQWLFTFFLNRKKIQQSTSKWELDANKIVYKACDENAAFYSTLSKYFKHFYISSS